MQKLQKSQEALKLVDEDVDEKRKQKQKQELMQGLELVQKAEAIYETALGASIGQFR